MKHFKTVLLIAVMTLGMGGIAHAQKLGHIDSEELIKAMPETKLMEAELQKMSKTYKDDIDDRTAKYRAKLKKYDAEQNAQTPETNAKRQAEVQQDAAKIQQANQIAQQEMQKKYNDLLAPILEKAQKAIEAVAAAKGIIYVFDSSKGKGLIVFEKGVDLFDAVKAKLGF